MDLAVSDLEDLMHSFLKALKLCSFHVTTWPWVKSKSNRCQPRRGTFSLMMALMEAPGGNSSSRHTHTHSHTHTHTYTHDS